MFYFLSKTIFHHGRRSQLSVRLPPSHVLNTNFPSLLSSPSFIRRISSSEKSNQHSFAASYLINKCGFSTESAQSASKHVNFKTLDKPDAVIAMFKRYAFSEADIFKLVNKYPQVLSCNPEKTLSPRLEFFHSKGISSSDIAHILCETPHLLHRGLENQITPTFNFLCDFLQSNEKAVTVIKGCSHILWNDCERILKPCINILEENSVPKSHIALLLRKWPRYVSPNHLRRILESVKEMGFDPSGSQFLKAVVVMIGQNKSRWERKAAVCKSWGWSDEEILAAFQKHPLFMTLSEDRIMAAMDFLINKMDCQPSFVAKYPILLSLSLEKRLIPRGSIVQFLLLHKLIDKQPNLATLFKYSEKSFVEKFVNRYMEAPHLLELYKEKLSLPK